VGALMEFVGVCLDTGAYAGDRVGLLVGRFEDGWKVVGEHISSTVGWAEADIRNHFWRRPDELRSEPDTYEWLGALSRDDIEARFGWAA